MLGPVQARQEQQVRRSRHKGSRVVRVIGYRLNHAFVSISRERRFCQIGCELLSPRRWWYVQLLRRSDCYSELLNREFIANNETGTCLGEASFSWKGENKREKEKQTKEGGRMGWHLDGHKIAGEKLNLPASQEATGSIGLRLRQWFLILHGRWFLCGLTSN